MPRGPIPSRAVIAVRVRAHGPSYRDFAIKSPSSCPTITTGKNLQRPSRRQLCQNEILQNRGMHASGRFGERNAAMRNASLAAVGARSLPVASRHHSPTPTAVAASVKAAVARASAFEPSF
jgi:hypothetical protein